MIREPNIREVKGNVLFFTWCLYDNYYLDSIKCFNFSCACVIDRLETLRYKRKKQGANFLDLYHFYIPKALFGSRYFCAHK